MPASNTSVHLTKPKNDLSAASKFQNGATLAYWGYKAFQVAAVSICEHKQTFTS